MAASLAALSSVASGYYHWVYFANRAGSPFIPVMVKFDLSALPDNHTVSYFISDQGPGPLMPGDTFQAIVSQIRLAGEVWNGVGTSDLRVKFGGISSTITQSSTPGIDIVFDDNMPPGLLAQSKPMTVNDLSSVANGAAFVPIARSRLQLRKDLTVYQQSSNSDAFFLTIVHEFGHTLGLQHTMTSGVMSTAPTRATTKAKPLSPDDIAGVSLLYPANGFPGATGSITGRVALAGSGVNLASVVALSTAGAAISGMTKPDGTYRIDGIPPGQYYVYVHPLPPPQLGEGSPANIVPPQDSTGRQFNADVGFGTEFLGGAHDWTQTGQVNVTAGNSSDGINFNVQRRAGPAVYNMTTYGYPGNGQVAIPEPPLQSGTRTYLAFTASGVVANNNQIAPGLNVSVIGGTAQIEAGTLRYWDQGYLLMVVDANAVSSDTPAALAVTVNNDLYVLPAAFTVVPSPPPAISSVSGNTDGQGNATVAIAGSNLAGTRILFDGAPASVLKTNPDGSLLVAAPPASGSYRATVEALSSDSQTSSQALGTAAPPTFTYNAPDPPAMSVNPITVAAGTDTMIEIIGYNTNFVDGQTVVGFGSSDILVRRVWVITPGLLRMNISVSAGAPQTITSITVASGLQLATFSSAFQIVPAGVAQVSLHTPIVNQATNLEGVPAGGTALIKTTGLPQNAAGWILTIANQQTSFSVGPGGVITALVPNGLPIGPQVVRLFSPSGESIPPVLMQIDAPPPAIITAVSGSGAAIDGSRPVRAGDSVSLTVWGLSDANNLNPAAASVRVNVSGIDHAAMAVIPLAGLSNLYTVQFVLASSVPAGLQQPMTVGISTRVSAPYFIAIR